MPVVNQVGNALTGATGTGQFVGDTSPTLVTPNIGTPSAGLLTNCSGLPVSGLANGTDGELITWDSSGVAATVAAGTAGQVLTSNGAGAAPTFQAPGGGGGEGAKAWVAFTGTGTVTIQDAFNVTSITDNSAGNYTINFTTAFAAADYCAVSGGTLSDTTAVNWIGLYSKTTTTLRVSTVASNGSPIDAHSVYVACFGDQ
jgi:hypothetical protein